MKCANCGYEFSEGMFCPECGTKYDAEKARLAVLEAEKKAALASQRELEKQEEEKRLAEEKEKQKVLERQRELKRLEEEKQREIAKQKELLKQQELQKKEDAEKRQIELAKAKIERERLAKEKADKEAELLKQKNEKIRMEQEQAKQREQDEQKKAEEFARTFRGQIYDSIEEMNAAKDKCLQEEAALKEQKKSDLYATLCMLFGIATFPLTMTLILWFPSIIISVILGVLALKRKTRKKGFLITGFIIDAIYLAIAVWAVMS